jgi:hypothetical protein
LNEPNPGRSRLATLPFRVLLELAALVAAAPRIWNSTTRKLLAAVFLVALVDLNSGHVRDLVRGLVTSWQSSQVLMQLGAIAGALDAEYASYSRYPEPGRFHEFVRTWVKGHPDDPSRDHWGSPIGFAPDGARYELWSCGRDRACGTADDIRYSGGP